MKKLLTLNFKFVFLCLLLGLGVSQARAEFVVPALTGPVVDEAHVLSERTAQKLSLFLNQPSVLEKIQLQILIVPNLQNDNIENASIKVVDQWKLGKKGRDNGVLFFISMQERKTRIEVGRGLEGDLPDVISKRILAEIVRPAFKKGQFDQGIVDGVLQILHYAVPDLDVSQVGQGRRLVNAPIGIPKELILFFLLFFVIIPLLRKATGQQGRRYYGGSGWGGGFGGGGGWSGGGGGGWSGGGGGFSGGGSSGSW